MSEERAPKASVGVVVAFCLPSMALSMLVAPATSILPGIYAKYFGLSLTSIAAAVLIARMFDAVTDPLIGYLSDRTIARGGSRKPWVLWGGILSVVFGWFLYAPPLAPTFTYFLSAYILFYVAMTMLDIPHNAWASELAQNYQDRTRIFGFKGIFGTLGQLMFFAIPFIPFLVSEQITPDVLRWSVILAAAVMLPSLYAAMRFCPKGNTGKMKAKGKILQDLKYLTQNRPFLVFLLIFVLAGLGFGIWGGLLFIVLDSYLHASEVTAAVFVLAIPTGLIGIPVWYFLSKKIGKKFTWQIAVFLLSLSMGSMMFLRPGAGSELIIMAQTAAVFFFGSCLGVLGPSIVGDSADYGTLKSGRDLNGTYFAVFTAITKANVGLGGALGLGIVGLFGYDPSAELNLASGNQALMTSFAVIPALLILISTLAMWAYPINERRHTIILRRIRTRPAVSLNG